jgi:hypothetical protein
MNPDPENFESLRRLLILKRYEQPPPGYFNHFSTRVIARIREGELGEPNSILQRLFGESAWWQRLSASLEIRPALAGAFGAAACALLISGIVYSENAAAPIAQAGMPSPLESSIEAAAMSANDALDQAYVSTSSINPVIPSAEPIATGSIFDRVPMFDAQPASMQFIGSQ